MKGIVFDIKEFAVHDGGGIRTTVFLKGCPLRCVWCHNPEGLSPSRELYVAENRCTHCGLCRRPCAHSDCGELGRCLHVCPQNLVRAVGESFEAEALAEKLLRHKAIFESSGGGVTLSGGEPLLQAEFSAELLGILRGRVHTAIETSGYASPEKFREVISLSDFVFMDIKIADSERHKKYTGVENGIILENAKYLKESGKPHRFRTPLIPGITDGEANLKAIAEIVGESEWEKLAYNHLASAKYKNVGREFLYKNTVL